MKTIKLLLIIPLLSLLGVGYAANVSVSGNVTDSNMPANNVMVVWMDSSSNAVDTAFTDTNGNYTCNINTGLFTQGMLIGVVQDCRGNGIYKTTYYNPGGTTIVNQNFVYCAQRGYFTATINGILSNIGSSAVTVSADTLGGAFANATAVAGPATGAYSLSIVSMNLTQDIWVYITDCNNNKITKKVTVSTTNTSATANFNYCSTTGGGALSTISGSVYMGNRFPSSGTVLLIESDSNTLTAVDSAFVQNGGYSFTLPDSNMQYYVKAYLNPSDSDYANYLPTYGDSSLFWAGGQLTATGGGQTITQDIHLLGGNNVGGPGFIGGSIYQGANKNQAVGDPIVGAQVMILQNGSPVAYTYSDAQGQFGVNNLAYGTYTVYTEVAGLPTTSVNVTLDAGKEMEENVSVSVNNSGVTTTIKTTSIEVNGVFAQLKAFPNPIQNNLTVQFGVELENVELTVLDLTGKVLFSNKMNQVSETSLSFEEFNAGTYLVRIVSNDDNSVIRVVKQ
ncbi:MAG: carboxypeptidase regulatory-like domain-containing protein [Salibacteraceae bacterium]